MDGGNRGGRNREGRLMGFGWGELLIDVPLGSDRSPTHAIIA